MCRGGGGGGGQPNILRQQLTLADAVKIGNFHLYRYGSDSQPRFYKTSLGTEEVFEALAVSNRAGENFFRTSRGPDKGKPNETANPLVRLTAGVIVG